MLKKNERSIEPDLTSNILKEGWLSKRSRLLKKWRRRWFVLTSTALYTFKHEKVYKKPTEVIPLENFTRVKSAGDEIHEEFVFKIETMKRSFYVVSNCASGKDAWIRALGVAMSPLNLEVSMYWITEFIKFEFGQRTHECTLPNDYSSLLALIAQLYKETLLNSFSLQYNNRNQTFSIQNQHDFHALQDTGRNIITIQIKLMPRIREWDIGNQATADSKFEMTDESNYSNNSDYMRPLENIKSQMTYGSNRDKNIGGPKTYLSSVYKVKEPEKQKNMFHHGNSEYQGGADKSPLSAVYGSNEEEHKNIGSMSNKMSKILQQETGMKMNWYFDNIGNKIKNTSSEFVKKAKGMILQESKADNA